MINFQFGWNDDIVKDVIARPGTRVMKHTRAPDFHECARKCMVARNAKILWISSLGARRAFASIFENVKFKNIS